MRHTNYLLRPLTIDNAKPRDKAYALTDGGGLLLEVLPSGTKTLFWEAGMVGQVLYLEAEAAGVRATGIGCFFDDPVHRVFGIEDLAFQSLYRFTVGGAIDDPRLTTLAPYGASIDEHDRGSDLP
jgi:hypothetical protein